MQRRPRPHPTATTTATATATVAAAAAATLLDLVAALEPFTLFAALAGGDHERDHRRVAIRILPPDPRSAAASLFGIVAPPGTLAVAVGVLGTGRPLGPAVAGRPAADGAGPGPSDLRIDLALPRDGTVRHRTRGGTVRHRTRGGTVRHRTRGDGEPAVSAVDTDGGCSGLLVDALHLVLGLPSPGACPPVAGLGLGLWSARLLRPPGGTIRTWGDAVSLLPHATVGPPTPAAVAVACRRFDVERTWADLRADAASGRIEAPDLSPAEADWLDTTAFARWCRQSLPSAGWTERELRTNSPEVADRYAEVVRRSR